MEDTTTGANGSGIVTPDSEMSNFTITLNIMRILLGLTAICGNSVIVACVFRYTALRTPTYYFIANLAVADFLNGCNMVAVPAMNLLVCAGLSATRFPIEGFRPGLTYLGFLMNNLAIFYIALERFICIKVALRYNSIVTFSRALLTVVFTWICGGIVTFLLAMLDLAETIIILAGICSIVSLVTVLLYIYVAVIAYKKSKQVAPQPQVIDGRTAEALDNQRVQWKITKFMALVLGMYFGSYLPWAIIRASAPDSLNTCRPSAIIGFFVVIIWGINININPYLYVWKSKNFRACIKKMLGIKLNAAEMQ